MNAVLALVPLASSLEPTERFVLGLPVTIALVVGAVLLLVVVLGAVFLPRLRQRNQARGNGTWERRAGRSNGTWGRR